MLYKHEMKIVANFFLEELPYADGLYKTKRHIGFEGCNERKEKKKLIRYSYSVSRV